MFAEYVDWHIAVIPEVVTPKKEIRIDKLKLSAQTPKRQTIKKSCDN